MMTPRNLVLDTSKISSLSILRFFVCAAVDLDELIPENTI